MHHQHPLLKRRGDVPFHQALIDEVRQHALQLIHIDVVVHLEKDRERKRKRHDMMLVLQLWQLQVVRILLKCDRNPFE